MAHSSRKQQLQTTVANSTCHNQHLSQPAIANNYRNKVAAKGSHRIQQSQTAVANSSRTQQSQKQQSQTAVAESSRKHQP